MFGMKVISFLFIILLIKPSYCINAKGCTPLDSWSFDKVISKFTYSIVKFDTAYPYGEKHEEFTQLSAVLRSNKNILVAEVGVKDYGDMENKDLADRFNVNVDEFPIVKLFIQGEKTPILFKGKFTFDGLKKFLLDNTDVYIGCKNCLEVFDKLASKFFATEDITERNVILSQAEKEWENTQNPSEASVALIYVKVFRKAVQNGKAFIKEERKRIEKLMKTKVSKEKLEELEMKKNILKSFTHEEL